MEKLVESVEAREESVSKRETALGSQKGIYIHEHLSYVTEVKYLGQNITVILLIMLTDVVSVKVADLEAELDRMRYETEQAAHLQSVQLTEAQRSLETVCHI